MEGKTEVYRRSLIGEKKAILSSESNFKEIRDSLIRSSLGVDPYTLIEIELEYEKALNEARHNNLEQSKVILLNINKIRKSHYEKSDIKLLLNLSALPVEAYIMYKKGKYKKAELILINSINQSFPLIEKGIFILEFHRIQQIHNIARMYFRQRNYDQAGCIINQALNYLAHKKKPLYGQKWSISSMDNAPYSLRCDMILQIALESVGEVMCPTPQIHLFYKIMFKGWNTMDPALIKCRPLNEWVIIMEKHLDGIESDKFLEIAVRFITSTSQKFDVLKISLLTSMCDFIVKEGLFDEACYEYLSSCCQQLRVAPHQKLSALSYLNQMRT